MILLTLVVGRFADRYDCRAIVSTCQGSKRARPRCWPSAARGLAGAREHARHRGAGGRGARVRGADHGARSMPGLVPRLAIPRAAAWAISATQTAQIVGPALGGLLYLAAPGAVMPPPRRSSWWRPFARRPLPPRVTRVPRRPCRRCSRAWSSSGTRPFSWATLSLDSSRCCWGRHARSCPSMPPTSSTPGPGGSRLLRSAPAVGRS